MTFLLKFLPELMAILMGAASRLLPHPPNATPLTAMALLSGFVFRGRAWAFLVPLGALFLSDLFLGLHELMLFTYGAFALTVWIGSRLGAFRWTRTLGAAFVSCCLFFLITNFGVWLMGSWYPFTRAGLVSCFVAAIPFFRNSMLADLGYTAVFFAWHRLWVRRAASVTARSTDVLNRS